MEMESDELFICPFPNKFGEELRRLNRSQMASAAEIAYWCFIFPFRFSTTLNILNYLILLFKGEWNEKMSYMIYYKFRGKYSPCK